MDRFRPSRNSSDDGWFRVGTIEVTTSVLIAGLCTVSIFVYALDKALLYWLWLLSDGSPFAGIETDGVRQGQVWRLVTWPLLNPPTLSSAISIVIIWWMGKELERTLGRIKYLWFVALLVFVPAVIYVAAVPTLVEPALLVISGASFLSSGIIIAFVLTYPGSKSFFGIPFWILVAVFEGLQILQLIGDRIWDGLLFVLVMMGVAALAARAFGLSEFEQIPKIPLPQFITKDPYQKSNRARAKTTRKAKGPTVVPIRGSGHLDRASQADMDLLLEKINATGIDSLTLAERRRLDEHSRRLRGS